MQKNIISTHQSVAIADCNFRSRMMSYFAEIIAIQGQVLFDSVAAGREINRLCSWGNQLCFHFNFQLKARAKSGNVEMHVTSMMKDRALYGLVVGKMNFWFGWNIWTTRCQVRVVFAVIHVVTHVNGGVELWHAIIVEQGHYESVWSDGTSTPVGVVFLCER